MKLGPNESIHCTGYEMVSDENFFGCFIPPAEAPKVRVMTSQRVVMSQRKGLMKRHNQNLGASAGGKAAKKFLSHAVSVPFCNQCNVRFCLH